MNRKLIFFLSILLLPAFITQVAAQTAPFFIEKLTTAEGLSSNKVNDIAEDDNGFLWIATSDGLNRFDGTEVIQYYYSDSIHSLPHNYVNCLKKLAGNCMAIGTEGGLSFYNGNTSTFRNFYYDQNKPLREFDNTIVGLEVDVKGNLWAASRNSIYIFDSTLKLTKVFKSTFTEADAARKRIRYVDKMIPLSNGDMLVCVYDGWYIGSVNSDSLTHLEQSNLKFQLDFVREASTNVTGEKFEMYFPYSHVFKIFDRWLVCFKPDQDSLLLMDEKGRQLGACFFPYNRYPYILWSQILTAIDSTHLLFLLHNFGLCTIPIIWKNGEPSLQNMSPLLFESSEYDHALCDRQGNWWLATTEAGLQKLSPYKQVFKSTVLMDAVSHNRVNYEVNWMEKFHNYLWLSTYGEGFFKIDLSNGKQQQYRLRNTGNDLWANFIWNVRQISSDSLWVGTQDGLFWFKISNQRCGRIANYPGKPAMIDSVSITTQFADSHGLIWMGLGRGKGVCYYNSREKKFSYFPGNSKEYPLRYPVGIAEDTRGDLWFTNDASATLVKWERSSSHFQTIVLPLKPNDRISNLYGIYCDHDSVCWLGTVTSGLVKYNIAKNTTSVFGHENGLINSHIRSIFPDSEKRWWLVTEGGLSCFDPATNTFFNFSENDGLPVRFPTTPFYYDEQTNRLYSGGKGIFFYFDPMKMNTSLPPQKTIITAVEVNGKSAMFTPGTTMTLQSNQDDITILYTAIDFNNGRQTKYVYKLIGKDTSWIMAGYQRQINFSHLAPGHYQFLVCSQNNQGILSAQQASIRFYIRPPFTQTAWFYGIMVLMIAGIFYGLYRFRLRQLLRTEQIRNEISKNLHDELGSTLTNISLGSLLIQKQIHPDAVVKRLLDRIYQDSQAVSQTMREIVWSINPKIDTMGEALPRMLQYASEMLEAKNIELEAEITPEIEQVKLNMEQRRDLYLIFKEAVNNLARHSEASRARISFIREDTSLVMTIADNGTGMTKTGSRVGNGLKNMKERALSHRWFLRLESNAGVGTTLTVRAKIA